MSAVVVEAPPPPEYVKLPCDIIEPPANVNIDLKPIEEALIGEIEGEKKKKKRRKKKKTGAMVDKILFNQ